LDRWVITKKRLLKSHFRVIFLLQNIPPLIQVGEYFLYLQLFFLQFSDIVNMINSIEKIYEPLLRLPHTYMTLYDKNKINSVEGRLFENSPEDKIAEWEENCTVAGLLLIVELIERNNVAINMSHANEAPMDEFFIITVPDELIAAFAFFETKRENKDIYDLDDIKYLGEAILGLPSAYNDNPKTFRRLHDVLSGGIDEQCGLVLLNFLFPEEEEHQEIEITETYWGESDEDVYLMIDQIRNEISMTLE
jgi:hypothetical protein